MAQLESSSFAETARSGGNPGAARDKNIDADHMFETILCGVHWNVLQIGAMSTLATACYQRKADWTLRPWRHTLQNNGKIMKAPLRYCADIGLTAAIGDDISNLYDRLADAKALTSPLTSNAIAYTGSDLQLLGQLEVKWRQLSLNAIPIMHVLKPEVKRRLPAQYSEDGRVLVRFLMEAANGETGRVSALGEITVPTLSQRRQAPRVGVQLPCRLVLPDSTLPALLFDVSRDGLGIICSHPLLDRQAVSIDLKDGRLLKAIVVRRDGDRKGLLLLKPLSSDDPLLGHSPRGAD